MRCPFCKDQKDRVVDSRGTDGGAVIRRRRQCLVCGKRFTTYERVEDSPRLSVIKKGGNRVPYDRAKILSGVERACWKRTISADAINALVDEVEGDLFRSFDREVRSEYIGNAVAGALQKLDKVAYLRYASMYHDFQIVDEFIDEAKALLERDREEAPGQQELFHD